MRVLVSGKMSLTHSDEVSVLMFTPLLAILIVIIAYLLLMLIIGFIAEIG